jgi:propanol-preferring alcohol dehydrogenase
MNLPGWWRRVVAFGRNDEKLAVAQQYGADHVINTTGKAIDEIRQELRHATGHHETDAAVDCAGAEETIQMGFALLATAGTYVSVGLVGTRISIPLFPFVGREFTHHGSFWGNANDLREIVALAQQGKIKHTLKTVRFDDINENLARLRDGDIPARSEVPFRESSVGRTEQPLAIRRGDRILRTTSSSPNLMRMCGLGSRRGCAS